MLKQLGKWTSQSQNILLFSSQTIFTPHLSCINPSNNFTRASTSFTRNDNLTNINVKLERASSVKQCRARRRVRYDVEEEHNDDEDGYNEDIAVLELYTQMAKDEVLLVSAVVDEEQVELLIFKGFSSCLSYKTSSDPSKSTVVPAKAVIKRIDRVRGPFDPSNVQYIEKGLTFQELKSRFK